MGFSRISTIGFLIGKIEDNTDIENNNVKIYTKTFSSMEELWYNRDEIDVFIVRTKLIGVLLGIYSLKKYCLENKKVLIIDDHECYPGCNEIITKVIVRVILNSKEEEEEKGEKGVEDLDPQNKIIRRDIHRDIYLRKETYNLLTFAAKKKIRSVYHETIPVIWENNQLISLYHNITFYSK